jgi:phosphatidylserine synthase
MLRFLLPQFITGARALLGAWALFLVIEGDLNRAAILLIVGVITDRLDGLAAKHLHVASEFGYMFDCFADYLFYVVTPTILAWRISGSPPGWMLASLSLPFLTGAARYARNIIWSRTESFDAAGFPGLPTLIWAFYVVALYFLKSEGEATEPAILVLLGITAPVFSGLMLAPVRYPKLAIHPWFLGPVIVGLNIMPFLWTAQLAWATLLLGSAYVLLAPVYMRWRESRCSPAVKF